MLMKMYDTKSSNNVINKVLENEHEFDIKFKDKTDIVNPVVILSSKTLILSNYAYIPDFNRYYFVDKIELFPNSIYHITLRCDVLESFKDEILASSGFINQQTKNVNKYYQRLEKKLICINQMLLLTQILNQQFLLQSGVFKYGKLVLHS